MPLVAPALTRKLVDDGQVLVELACAAPDLTWLAPVAVERLLRPPTDLRLVQAVGLYQLRLESLLDIVV